MLKLKAGMEIRCVIQGVQVEHAKIQEELYICQNKVRGRSCQNKLGYEFSWVMPNKSKENRLDENNIEYFQIIPKDLEYSVTLKEMAEQIGVKQWQAQEIVAWSQHNN